MAIRVFLFMLFNFMVSISFAYLYAIHYCVIR